MIRSSLALVLIIICTFSMVSFAEETQEANQKPDALMLRFPDVSESEIVFIYGGDVWIVSKEGGVARKLSSPQGRESFPKFSPGGDTVAFSGNYDGNTDVYVMPRTGGMPKRLTHHPEDDLVVEWYPDGASILTRSKMISPRDRYNRFFKVPLSGGIPEALPLPFGELASFSPDGESLSFQYLDRQSTNAWKRYKGGTASDLWIYGIDDKSLKQITDYEGADALPMWHGDTIYFLSDRGEEERLNIWAYDTQSEKIRQVTRFTEFDVKWPSLGPGDIVFENGGALYLLDLSDESYTEVSVEVPDDLPELRPSIKKLANSIENFSISPSGKRALFEARGEIFTLPQKRGSARNLTQTSGTAERYPVWSPDGKNVAYFSDKSGEYELYTRPSDGKGEETRITSDGGGYKFKPVWSPDSKKIAYIDKTGSLYIADTGAKKPLLVTKDERTPISSYSWSPDSRWLTYPVMSGNGLKSVMVYDTKNKKEHKITTDFYNDNSPVFDPGGNYIYFYSDRSFTPVYGDMDDTWIYPNSTGVYAITLREDTLSPTAPRSDEETETESVKRDENNKDSVKIDFDGIEERVVKLPVGAGNFGALRALEGKVIYLRLPKAGASDHGSNGKLQFYSLEHGSEKTVMPGIDRYEISSDGKKLIYKTGDNYGIVDFGEGKKNSNGRLDVSKLRAQIDPKEEWPQIFNDAWRIQRDLFYDPKMHGVDWDQVKLRYETLLPYVVDREDLNFVISEMMGELNSSHTYIGGGDIQETVNIPVGLLGADFELDEKNSAFRIKKIYGASSNIPDVSSPLKEPGVSVVQGDYLLTVNGRPLDTAKDPWAAFQGLQGEVVELGVSSTPKAKDIREVLVKPISKDEERRLRYYTWVEENRQIVEDATGGRVGYIYVPDTGWGGQNELVRQFTPQQTKEALIIDERFNGGGQVPDRFVELLDRPLLNFWAIRDFEDWQTPSVSHSGPKVMLINGWAGSGGDAFPYYFRKKGLGPLIGTRTHGGLIGIGGNPRFVDGGYVTAPTYAFYNLDGEWDVEGIGVSPDIEVPDLPSNLNDSDDQQLEKAIEVIMEQLEKSPSQRPDRPLYQDRSGGNVSN